MLLSTIGASVWAAVLGMLGITTDDDNGVSWSGIALFVLAFMGTVIGGIWVAGKSGLISAFFTAIGDYIRLVLAPVTLLFAKLAAVL